MSAEADTIAALATPTGESAIAVVRTSGPLSRELAASFLGSSPPPRSIVHTAIKDLAGKPVDDVLITFFAAPNSYTGEDVLEISGHGNPLVAHTILRDLFARGCRLAEPGEFTRRAFLNGRMDLSQAEAVMDLIRAKSDRAIEAANRQLHGELGRHVAALSDSLLDTLARAEAYIDFPEEDLPPEDREVLRNAIDFLITRLGALIATSRYGELLRAGVRTVLIGETNAGKSSLLNRFLGWDRAIVSPEPGTTRDFLEESRTIGGHCIRFVDTAGVNSSPGAVEGLGIARAFDLAEAADLVLLVLDATLPFPSIPPRIWNRLHPSNAILVWNKTDLAPSGTVPAGLEELLSVSVSAVNGTGISALETAIADVIERHRKDPGPELVAINARHAHDLCECKECLTRALAKITSGESDEFLAADLRNALDALGRIGGKIDNEQMLDRLFAAFCIGK